MRRTSYAWPLRKALGAVPGRLLGALADTLALRLPRPSLAVQPFDGAFDGRFDRLWERAQSEHPAITRRDAALLNWRYRQHPDTRYRALTIDDGGTARRPAPSSRRRCGSANVRPSSGPTSSQPGRTSLPCWQRPASRRG